MRYSSRAYDFVRTCKSYLMNSEKLLGLGCGCLTERYLQTRIGIDGIPVGCSRRKLESCGVQILDFEPHLSTFNFLGTLP